MHCCIITYPIIYPFCGEPPNAVHFPAPLRICSGFTTGEFPLFSLNINIILHVRFYQPVLLWVLGFIFFPPLRLSDSISLYFLAVVASIIKTRVRSGYHHTYGQWEYSKAHFICSSSGWNHIWLLLKYYHQQQHYQSRMSLKNVLCCSLQNLLRITTLIESK